MSEDWTQHYQPAKQALWQGRTDAGPRQYFYQVAECIDLAAGLPELDKTQHYFALLGFSSEEGVRRNLGRLGATQGPDALRSALGSLSFHAGPSVHLFDCGNIVCKNNDLELAQDSLSQAVQLLLQHNIRPILIGGGHEIAWGHYQALNQHFSKQPIGIINFDAHFDLRPLIEDQFASSGTPFWQIAQLCKQQSLSFDYTCLGIQQAANPAALFETANDLQVNYVHAHEIHYNNSQHCLAVIDDALNRDQHIYLTICLDVFSQAFAPGVSAPQSLGLQPWQVTQILNYIVKSNRVVSFDIAELSPPWDQDGKTAKLAARLVFEYIHAVIL